MRSFGISAICLIAATLPAWPEEISTISIPASASLAAISTVADSALPRRLVNETTASTCVEPERLCTKIPEFRGFKIYTRLECIDVTPRIDCSIEQVVDRAGPLSITGSRDRLTVRQAFEGRATVYGRGEIGRHIRETATGGVTLTVSLTPRITQDWSIEADVDHRIEWTRTPKARLFDIFPVTFETKATEALNREIEAYKANDLPRELGKIDLKAKIAPLWADLQSPVRVAMPTGRDLFLLFRPSAVALAPLDVAGDRVSTRLSVTGQFLLTDESVTEIEEVPLPALSAEPPAPGISLTVPVEIGLGTLSELASAELPARLEFDEPVHGTLEIHSVDLSETEGRDLFAVFDASVTAFGVGPVMAPFSLTGKPYWIAETETLALLEPTVNFDGDGVVAHFLNVLASSPVALAEMAQFARVPLGAELDALEANLSEAFDRTLAEGVRSQLTIDVSIADLVLDGGLRLTAQADGNAALTAFELD